MTTKDAEMMIFAIRLDLVPKIFNPSVAWLLLGTQCSQIELVLFSITRRESIINYK